VFIFFLIWYLPLQKQPLNLALTWMPNFFILQFLWHRVGETLRTTCCVWNAGQISRRERFNSRHFFCFNFQSILLPSKKKFLETTVEGIRMDHLLNHHVEKNLMKNEACKEFILLGKLKINLVSSNCWMIFTRQLEDGGTHRQSAFTPFDSIYNIWWKLFVACKQRCQNLRGHFLSHQD